MTSSRTKPQTMNFSFLHQPYNHPNQQQTLFRFGHRSSKLHRQHWIQQRHFHRNRRPRCFLHHRWTATTTVTVATTVTTTVTVTVTDTVTATTTTTLFTQSQGCFTSGTRRFHSACLHGDSFQIIKPFASHRRHLIPVFHKPSPSAAISSIE